MDERERMGDQRYFVIHNGEGDTTVDIMDHDELLVRLKEKYYGPNNFIERLASVESNTNYWGGKLLIIKGKVVVPKPKKVVETYEL